MTISVLTDDHPGVITPAEHGLSYLVEFGGIRLLFDTGQSNLFLRNALTMGIDMTHIDTIVLSHGHFDHGNGLTFLTGGKLVCHPGCFVKRYRKADSSYIGLTSPEEEINNEFELLKTNAPYKIIETIFFLGEIPRLTDFESIKTPFELEGGIPDFVMDDSAVALLTGEGLFVVTGCGHAGIVNTLEYARKVTGESRIFGIIGGFHLKKVDRQTKETIRYLRKNGVQHVFPSHCTQPPALSVFSRTFKTNHTKTGDILKF
ncbi:MAG: MBL fold metallo-hydrolase [Lentimicrobiaceae bacterium]|nr:MBL fold metallo-hydrolase [Lentimicrobiaceae bacterium]